MTQDNVGLNTVTTKINNGLDAGQCGAKLIIIIIYRQPETQDVGNQRGAKIIIRG